MTYGGPILEAYDLGRQEGQVEGRVSILHETIRSQVWIFDIVAAR
jgi:hypothetical protein